MHVIEDTGRLSEKATCCTNPAVIGDCVIPNLSFCLALTKHLVQAVRTYFAKKPFDVRACREGLAIKGPIHVSAVCIYTLLCAAILPGKPWYALKHKLVSSTITAPSICKPECMSHGDDVAM